MKKMQWMEGQKGRVGLWIATGPLLLVAGLITALVRLGAFGFATAIFTLLAFVLSWKGKIIGALLGALLAGIAFMTSGATVGDASWWHALFVSTLLLSFFVTALALNVGEARLVENEERLVEKIEELEEQSAATMKAHLQEKITAEQKNEERNLEIKRLIEEVDAFKRLVAASEEESAKFYNHNCDLQEEIKTFYETQDSAENLRERLHSLEKRNAELQKEVNHHRVEHYQKDLLAKDLLAKDFLAKDFLAYDNHDPQEDRAALNELATLRAQAKKAYEQMIADYKEVTEKIASAKAPELTQTLSTKREELAHLRERIFKLEGEMLKTQQKFKGAISPEEGYLAIADGECHRLEQENRFLLDLIQKLSTRSDQKGAPST